MRITWLGHSSFLIESGEKKLVTDPFDKIGLEFPSVKADVVATSHSHFDHCATDKVAGSPRVVSGTGEFKEEPFDMAGFPTYHDESKGSERGENTVYVIEAEGLRVCHLGDLGHSLSQDEVVRLGRVDVLMIPVGGVYTLDDAGAANVAETISPKVILPMHYKVPGLSLPIADVAGFTNRFQNVREADFLDVTPESLPGETEVVVLKMKS
jgi:L-ascorbate metabolism protein UlaG (beta-lactamase superfamily)